MRSGSGRDAEPVGDCPQRAAASEGSETLRKPVGGAVVVGGAYRILYTAPLGGKASRCWEVAGLYVQNRGIDA